VYVQGRACSQLYRQVYALAYTHTHTHTHTHLSCCTALISQLPLCQLLWLVLDLPYRRTAVTYTYAYGLQFLSLGVAVLVGADERLDGCDKDKVALIPLTAVPARLLESSSIFH